MVYYCFMKVFFFSLWKWKEYIVPEPRPFKKWVVYIIISKIIQNNFHFNSFTKELLALCWTAFPCGPCLCGDVYSQTYSPSAHVCAQTPSMCWDQTSTSYTRAVLYICPTFTHLLHGTPPKHCSHQSPIRTPPFRANYTPPAQTQTDDSLSNCVLMGKQIQRVKLHLNLEKPMVQEPYYLSVSIVMGCSCCFSL